MALTPTQGVISIIRLFAIVIGGLIFLTDQAKITTDPSRAGSFPDNPIDVPRTRYGNDKRKVAHINSVAGLRATTKTNQSWKSVFDKDRNIKTFKCPKCGSVVRYDARGFAFCTGCSWAPSLMTRAERAKMEARDPDMIPFFQYLEKMELHAPRFEGHANTKRISGKDRREKRFLSKCARGGA
jgi:predicted RNA-binding Zn-ribbon protein involved in translation (DUF1610 family)